MLLSHLFHAYSTLVSSHYAGNGGNDEQQPQSRKQRDLVTDLPGFNYQNNLTIYSGYLNATSTRFLHYMLVESQGDPANDPIVLWYNGGPGCSSLQGLFTELGPFHVNRDNATLWENVFSWNKIANMIFLEGPTGVGFSYSNPTDDHTNDQRTMQDFYNALRDFFDDAFPEYQGRDFYITGESYAGIYIPATAKLVIDGMKNGEFKGNLKGFAIGNGALSEIYQTNSIVNFMYYHGVIGDDIWYKMKGCCKDACMDDCNLYDFIYLQDGNEEPKNDILHCEHFDGRNCITYLKNLLLFGNDEYNLYRDCYSPVTKQTQRQRELRDNFRRLFQSYDTARKLNYEATDANGGFSCWGEDSMYAYLNRPDVQKALHIPDILTKDPKFQWLSCSETVDYDRQIFETESIFDYIWDESDVRMLIYNGDVDMICNFLGDEWFMSNFTDIHQIPTLVDRYAWYYRGAISGYVKHFERIDVATVKGAGHFVPTDRPGPALQMLKNFIDHTNDYSKPSGISEELAPLTGESYFRYWNPFRKN